MQFYNEPEISWSEWMQKACIQDNQLTELGEFLHKKLSGGEFIDVPCGHASSSILGIAQTLDVSEYIEVDNDAAVLGDRLKKSPRIVGGVTISTYCSDILDFISQLEVSTSATRAIYISGLQPDEEFCKDASNVADCVIPYLESLYDELARVCKVGDLVIFNEARTLAVGIEPAAALTKRHFVCQRTCPHGKVQIYEKTTEKCVQQP